MVNKLNVSKSASGLLLSLSSKLRLRPNIIARNALMFSISRGDKYVDGINLDFSGKEFNIYTLLGPKTTIYELLINQYYKENLGDNRLAKILNFHIERGVKSPDFIGIFS